jgi:hypothetical protein
MTTPPLYEQLSHGTVRTRALAWFATHSYGNVATRGAAFALAVSLVAYLVRELDRWIAGGLSPETPITLRGFIVDNAFALLFGALLMCLTTAGARGFIRLYVRGRTERGLS